MFLKKRVIRALEDKNYTELLGIAGEGHGIFRILISLAYDREKLICWRAIEAVGLVAGETARKEPEAVRNLIGRLLWTIREESGGIGWCAPEMLGEIVRNSPDKFQDIAPVIASFHDEAMLRPGVLRAVVRISEVMPELLRSQLSFVREYLHDENPLVRIYAVMIAGIFSLREYVPDIEELLKDESAAELYENGQIQSVSVKKTAEKTVILLRNRVA